MQKIVYPDERKHPWQAEYGIFSFGDDTTRHAGIVVIDSRSRAYSQPRLVDSAERRDALVNKILSTDLRGVRLDHIRLFVLEGPESFTAGGYELPIRLDMDDYRRRGNPVEIHEVAPTSIKGWLRYMLGVYVRRETVYERDVVGGCAAVSTDSGSRRSIPAKEARMLLNAVDSQPCVAEQAFEARIFPRPNWTTPGNSTLH